MKTKEHLVSAQWPQSFSQRTDQIGAEWTYQIQCEQTACDPVKPEAVLPLSTGPVALPGQTQMGQAWFDTLCCYVDMLNNALAGSQGAGIFIVFTHLVLQIRIQRKQMSGGKWSFPDPFCLSWYPVLKSFLLLPDKLEKQKQASFSTVFKWAKEFVRASNSDSLFI